MLSANETTQPNSTRKSGAHGQKQGYYEVPRSVSMTELANILDISYQALSERLRRAHANLIDRMITPTELEMESSTKPR